MLKGKRRNDQLKLLLKDKEKRRIKQKEELEQEMVRKLNWVQTRMLELKAEENAVERSLAFHGNVEEFATKSMETLKRLQSSREAALIGWKGCSFDLTSSGVDRLSSPTVSESIFAEILQQTERKENVLIEVERGVAECVSKKEEAIDLEAEEAASCGAKRGQEMPPPLAPKAKKAPAQLGEPMIKIEKPEVKAMPKIPEKEKRRDHESEEEKKKQHYDYESLDKAVESERVPRELLYVEIGQQQWEVLSKDSRNRLLQERKTSDECFFDGVRGHRAYYCKDMRSLALRVGKHLGQQRYGNDRKHSLWCSSCVYWNATSALQGTPGRFSSGWYNRARSSCNWRSSCKLCEDRELVRLSERELKDHLIEVGLLGEQEAEKLREKRKPEVMKQASKARSSGNEPRSVSVCQSEGPDRKKQKKEER